MKQLLTFVCAALLALGVLTAQAQSVKNLDAKNGFLGATFGMPVSQLQGVRLHSTVGPKQVYEQVSKLPTIGGYHLSRVHYTFYNNQLCSIMLNISGKGNNDGVLRALQQSYGPGAAEGRTRTWEGQRVSMLFGTMGQDNGVVSISSKALVKQMQAGGTLGQPRGGVLNAGGQ